MFASSAAAGLPRAGSGQWRCRNEGRAVLDAHGDDHKPLPSSFLIRL